MSSNGSGAGRRFIDVTLRAVCDTLRRQQALTIGACPTEGVSTKATRVLLTALARDVRRALTDPGRERAADSWDLAVFGHRGRLSFTGISQPWLARAGKAWAGEELPRHRGGGATKVREKVNALARLSESLRARDDHGLAPELLGRKDIDSFLNRLAYLESTGTISRYHRNVICRDTRAALSGIRALGLTRPGRVAAGLPGDFALGRRRHPRRTSTRRTRPRPAAGDHGRAVRPPGQSATGRGQDRDADRHRHRPAPRRHPRPAAWTAWHRDNDGAAVLVYDNAKADRLGRRLPITEATAAVITAQQARVRATFPRHPGRRAETAALATAKSPRAQGNHASPRSTSGTVHGHDGLGLAHRDGTEFDKTRIVPYAYRHTYAQRHADAGVPIDVLAELLDHRNLNITRGYYRVGEDRRRAAVDTVTAMSFDRHGNRIWRDAAALLDSEHARYAVGEVAVPYGALHRTVQRAGRRRRLPGPVPLRRLRPLPHRRVLPARPDRLPRRPAPHPGTTGRGHRRRRRLGPRRRHPHPAGDHPDPAAHHPHQRRPRPDQRHRPRRDRRRGHRDPPAPRRPPRHARRPPRRTTTRTEATA